MAPQHKRGPNTAEYVGAMSLWIRVLYQLQWKSRLQRLQGGLRKPPIHLTLSTTLPLSCGHAAAICQRRLHLQRAHEGSFSSTGDQCIERALVMSAHGGYENNDSGLDKATKFHVHDLDVIVNNCDIFFILDYVDHHRRRSFRLFFRRCSDILTVRAEQRSKSWNWYLCCAGCHRHHCTAGVPFLTTSEKGRTGRWRLVKHK